MAPVTKERDTSRMVEEELQRARAAGQKPAPSKRPWSAALGIIEIAAGIAAVIFSFAANIALAIFLGAAVLVAGILETVNGAIQRSMMHFAIGIIGAIAGVYILANPLTSFGLISFLIGAYLVASGAVSAYRARQTRTSMTGGLIEVLIGLVVLLSGFSIGLMVGLYLIIRGIMTYNERPAQRLV